MSILIGVNDIWHPLNANREVSAEKFEQGYDKLLADTVAALPEAKSSCSNHSSRRTAPLGKRDVGRVMRAKFQAIVAKLGAKYHAPVVKLQAIFDAAGKRAPPPIGSGMACIRLTPATS